MDQGSSKQCRTACCCCNTWNNFQLCIGIIDSHLIHKPCHSVNSCISAADHGNCFTFLCLLKSKHASIHLFLHRCGHKFFSRKIILYQININRVANDYITVFHGMNCFPCHLVIRSGSYSDYKYFTQNESSNPGQPLQW